MSSPADFPLPASRPEPEATPHSEARVRPACILVVDDQPANIQIVGGILGQLGHEIVPAADGPTALRKLAMRRPDLILMDLFMPGMDGCETCRQIHSHPEWSGIPVIFLSAADDKDLVVRAMESGGVDYVTKPFHHAELLVRVQTQLALKSARDQLAQLAEDKDELIGILTHDLKGHLAGIEMSARLLQECVRRTGQADARVERLAENIACSGGGLLSFVKEFLANVAADHGLTIKLENLNLAAAAGAVVERYREIAARKQIVIDFQVSEGDATVLADSMALDKILENLVSNAVKFSPLGRRIHIRVRPQPGRVDWCIRDEGPGFRTDDHDPMFRRYRRLSARPTAGEPSTGLGLSIVRRLIEASKAELVLESAPGEGACWRVRLPRPSQT